MRVVRISIPIKTKKILADKNKLVADKLYNSYEIKKMKNGNISLKLYWNPEIIQKLLLIGKITLIGDL